MSEFSASNRCLLACVSLCICSFCFTFLCSGSVLRSPLPFLLFFACSFILACCFCYPLLFFGFVACFCLRPPSFSHLLSRNVLRPCALLSSENDSGKSAQVLKRKSMLQFKPTKATTHSRCHTRACGSMCCCRTNEECKRKRRKKREEGRNSTAEPMSPKTEHNTVQGKGGQAKQQRAQTNHKPNQTGLWQKGQKL